MAILRLFLLGGGLKMCAGPRYGHLQVVEQLMAAPGINLDQLNQVNCDILMAFAFIIIFICKYFKYLGGEECCDVCSGPGQGRSLSAAT